MFKICKFRKKVREERWKTFEEMKNAKDQKEGSIAKEKYEAYDKMENPGGHVSRDTLFSIGGSLLMTILVLHYEKLDIVTSKCFSWVKPRKF